MIQMDSQEITYGDKTVKKKNRRGFIYAENFKGVLVKAKDVSNAEYRCPFCKKKMHLLHPHNGEPVFALNPNTVHSNPVCEQIVKNGSTHDLSLTTPEDFFDFLSHTPAERGKRKGPGSGDEGGDNPAIEPDSDDDSEEMPIRREKFTSLKQIYEYGLDKFDVEDLGNGHSLSDYILYFKNHTFFFGQDGMLQEIGGRVLQVKSTTRFLFYGRNPVVYFKVFWYEDLECKQDYREITIAVRFPTEVVASEFKKRYFERIILEENGRTITRYRPKYRYFLFASPDWFLIDKEGETCMQQGYCGDGHPKDEYCAKCCGEYLMDYRNPKQMFGFEPIDYSGEDAKDKEESE